jgi:methanethiol S-methyltransferase
MHKYFANVLILPAYILGGSSLVLFGAFCYGGSLPLIQLGLHESGALILDACLSLTFFLQHSCMVRRSFRQFLARLIPETYISAIYAISSGIVLIVVVVFWQETSGAVAHAEGAVRLLLRAAFAASIVGLYWGVKSLGFFDAFGVGEILNHLRNKKLKKMTLSIRGPYRWVRHPLYLFVMIMIWSCPDLTLDRLLFNILWTVWIFIGTLLEEFDLLSQFGEEYRQYQRTVPMLIPLIKNKI